MYCKTCKTYFDEPIVNIEEEVGFREELCPCCGDDNIEETQACKCCGEQTINEFCDNCMEMFADEMLDFQRRYGLSRDVLEEMVTVYFEL